MKPHRLVFQLTSLLDLLLIVMFAQYLEMRVQEEELRSTMAAERQSLEQELWRRSTEATLSRQEMDRMMSLIESVFQKDPQELLKLLGRPQNEQPSVSDAAGPGGDLQLLRTRLVRHFQTHDEMRKRIDLWQLHLAANGIVRVDTGRGLPTVEFRVTTAEQVAQDLFALSKTVDQPKSLVVMLLTWGDARFGDRQVMEQGLELAAERMQKDAGTRSRIERATLGYRSDTDRLPQVP
ncbi:hypothetical protein Spb1_16160 [Planctopirus ephydatiae]|uniref:Uncharacterized protein n=1 Tax=Planctopirus ephydatiae TaxID=2528019 RepID=A0A518GM21_9PLAN|nr:hypothetical protein [Planctopirus ephydatiae]QDV29702.1 hypothetical protein Spb1_16160 [Planctopirus ephydatiae]